MALSSVKKAFTAKPAYAGDPNCDFLAEACRKATAKNAYQPDDNLKALIVSKINENTPGAQVPIKVTYDIIRRRLQMENPHKQWLAVDMTRHLLSACHERLRPYRTELLYHVARVAIKPNKKGPITAQHKARKAATDYLHQCGEEGQNALRMARMQLGNFQQSGGMPIGPLGPYGPDGHPMNPTGAYSTVPQPSSQLDGNSSGVKRGTPRIANVQQPTGDVIQDVRNLIDTANSHCNVLNDLVLAASTDPGEDRRERDRPLLAELKNEMLQVKDMFPGLLEKLSTLKTPESEQLMVQALEAHEQIEVCLDMERQYTEGTLPGGVSDGDDDEEEEEEEEGEDAAAADEPGADAAVAEAAADVEKAAHVEGATANEAVPAAAPPGGDVMGDLLSFGDSGPLPNAGEPVASAPVHARQVSEDMFGLNGLRADLPAGTAHAASHAAPETAASATGHDDPFLGGVSQESATTQQPAQPTGANPFAEAQQAPTPANGAFVSQGSGPAPPAQNPFGSSAFPLAPSPTGAAPGGPAPGAAGASTTPQPFPPQQPPPGQQPFMQFGAGPSGQGPPPGQGLPPGQGPPPGQYGAPPPYMGGHTGGMPPHGYGPPPGYQMYGQPAPGWGQPPTGQGPGQAPNPFGGSAFPPPSGLPQYGPPPGQYGGQGQQYGGPQGFPGGMPPQANPFGGPGGTAPMQQNLGPPHFGASATGMAAPGYSAPPANPFMASATGYGQPSWNPNAQKDAFQDLIIEHNKRSNPTPPMAQPMRQAGGAANGAM